MLNGTKVILRTSKYIICVKKCSRFACDPPSLECCRQISARMPCRSPNIVQLPVGLVRNVAMYVLHELYMVSITHSDVGLVCMSYTVVIPFGGAVFENTFGMQV